MGTAESHGRMPVIDAAKKDEELLAGRVEFDPLLKSSSHRQARQLMDQHETEACSGM